MMRRLLAALAIIGLLGLPGLAQERAALVSDSLEITGDTRLIATGNVEVLYQGFRLRASRIVYDQAGDRLIIDGPITLTDASGGTIILASQADLSADLQNGILTSARLVLNRQLQLAANQMTRTGGRYTTLDQVVASSCQVCADNPTPLWEIRARRVTHDATERQLYFDHATMRLAGIPIFYVPRLRMPDPTLDRATGVLTPSLRSTSGLGTGIKVPYFIALGPSRDLTVTPYITTKGGRSVELRYRQAFNTGTIDVVGAFSRDRILPGQDRGYLFATGRFALPRDFTLTFGLQTASDPAYLLDYGISGGDRLDSRIEIARTRRNGHISARIISFQTLRDDEDNTNLPSVVADLTFHRRFSLGPLGGEGGLRLQAHSRTRTSDNPLDGPDLDTIADGRDVARVSARIDWRRSFVLPMGIEATVLGEAQLDAYHIAQDAVFAQNTSRAYSAAGVELRWPWSKSTATGVTHVIEPVAQLIWADRTASGLPNEDSALVEFDEGNLYTLDRFPGADAVEQGARATLGVTWTRYDPTGWTVGLTLGRVFRATDAGQFGPASGLSGSASDWLASVNVDWPSGFAATGRVVFDDDFSLTKAEARVTLNRERLSLATSTLWVVADPSENRPDPTREATFDARWKATERVIAKFSGSYDFEADRGTLAGLGVEFRTECLVADLSLSRRFTSSTSVTPETSFGLSVDLIGIGGGKTAGPARRCR